MDPSSRQRGRSHFAHITVVEHTYSPNLAPLRLLSVPKKQMVQECKWQRLGDVEANDAATPRQLKNLTTEDFHRICQQQKWRQQKCILSQREYFEGDHIETPWDQKFPKHAWCGASFSATLPNLRIAYNDLVRWDSMCSLQDTISSNQMTLKLHRPFSDPAGTKLQYIIGTSRQLIVTLQHRLGLLPPCLIAVVLVREYFNISNRCKDRSLRYSPVQNRHCRHFLGAIYVVLH